MVKMCPDVFACDCDLTVELILIECGDFAEVRESSVIEVFDFLQEMGLFYGIYMYCWFMITCVLKCNVDFFSIS